MDQARRLRNGRNGKAVGDIPPDGVSGEFLVYGGGKHNTYTPDGFLLSAFVLPSIDLNAGTAGVRDRLLKANDVLRKACAGTPFGY